MTPSSPPRTGTHSRGIVVRFGVYLAILAAILAVFSVSRSLLIAPPYAVTAFLVVFDRGSSYSRRRNVVAAYLAVIASSVALTTTVGTVEVALVVNLVLVSAFVTFTPFAHPPALALTIFAYISHDAIGLAFGSLLVLGMVVVLDVLLTRVEPHGTRFGRERPSGPP